MGRLSRVKGRAFEQAIARKLRPLFGSVIKRGYQTQSGKAACDVEGSPYWIECKHQKVVNIRAALAQAKTATDGRPIVVVAKDNGVRPIVCMELTDWLELVARELPQIVVEKLKGVANDKAKEAERDTQTPDKGAA
jgi:hypothetical protein